MLYLDFIKFEEKFEIEKIKHKFKINKLFLYVI